MELLSRLATLRNFPNILTDTLSFLMKHRHLIQISLLLWDWIFREDNMGISPRYVLERAWCRTDGRWLTGWIRRRRERLNALLLMVGKRVKRQPSRVYVMGQRTQWGNCSALANLSFNWRLVMAPDECCATS